MIRISDQNLISLDECGFNFHTQRTYGYSLRNTKAFVEVPANRGINRSLMCAISNTGIVAAKYKEGAWNGPSFMNFITEVLTP